MVEEARDIRDRGYLAINLLLGGIATAVGLFNMFALHNFGAAPMFDALLGMSMISVGALFIAPYMAPRELGLPAPGVRMARRPYLPFPVPIPASLERGRRGREEFEGEEELPMLPAPRRRPAGAAARPRAVPAPSPVSPPMAGVAASAGLRAATPMEAAATIAELEALGTAPVAPRPAPPRPHLPPFRPTAPPPAEYLEEEEAVASLAVTPELEPQFKRALEDLAGAAALQTNGAHPLALVNGKPPERTLSDLEEVLRQPSPSAPQEPRLPQSMRPPISTSTVPQEAVGEVDQLEQELQTMPRVESVLPAPISTPVEEPFPATIAEASTPSSALPEPELPAPLPLPVEPLSGPVPGASPPSEEAPGPPTVAPSEVAPVSDVKDAASSLPTIEEAMGTKEGQLEEMARTLESMVSQIRSEPEEVPPEPVPSLTEAAAPAPPAPEPTAPLTPETFSEENEPAPAIDDLERQLAAMRSTLVREGPKPLPRPGSAPRKAPEAATLPLPLPPAPSPEEAKEVEPPKEAESVDELDQLLEDASSAAKLTQERHIDHEKNARRRRKSGP
ncbi:MAG: hypothetical protein KGI98_01200 [Euryarchaeota archaeon]|nr:hypothetical protein [Euryarchaeota archaeon]